ncbi:MAG: SIR2 family NAD-dependent protein deacylase [Desulfobacteraceae bacterium]
MEKDSEVEEVIQRLGKDLAGARRVSVLTGAGISAESGVPTFRGADGLWKDYHATDLATPQAFARDPELVWEFYNWRRALISKVTFNPAHKALVELENRIPDFTLITQNVDGLHLLAGSRNVLEIHGNLWRVRCTGCGRGTLDQRSDLGRLPKCEECGALLRPDVVWFGESLDPDVLGRAVEAVRACEIMLVIGTSAVVQPAASMAMEAKRAGAAVAEINLEPTEQSKYMDYALQGKAGEIIPRVARAALDAV